MTMTVVREGLRALLHAEEDMEVVGEAETAVRPWAWRARLHWTLVADGRSYAAPEWAGGHAANSKK